MRKVILIFICFICFVGCGNRDLRNQMRAFMSREIVLPSVMSEICSGKIRGVDNMVIDVPTLIMFYGKEECSLCAISHLYDDLSGFQKINDVMGCKVIILFSLTTVEEVLDVPSHIKDLNFPFPVYIDEFGEFYRQNKDFPSDRRFHSFLVDADGHPVFIGNPLSSEKLWEIFENTLSKIIIR